MVPAPIIPEQIRMPVPVTGEKEGKKTATDTDITSFLVLKNNGAGKNELSFPWWQVVAALSVLWPIGIFDVKNTLKSSTAAAAQRRNDDHSRFITVNSNGRHTI